VHAAWHQPSIEAVRSSRSSVLELYDHYEGLTRGQTLDTGLTARAEAELARMNPCSGTHRPMCRSFPMPPGSTNSFR